MYSRQYFPLVLLLLVITVSSNAQIKISDKPELKDGIYLTIEDFRANSPSFSLLSTTLPRDVFGNMTLKIMKYSLHGKIQEIAAGDIWGICVDGTAYVRHNPRNKEIEFGAADFYKIFSRGQLCTYFFQERKESGYYYNPVHPAASMKTYPPKYKFKEYIVDLNTGKIYNKKRHVDHIIKLIKSDPYFMDIKIKSKDLGAYITQYNRRHPPNELMKAPSKP